jgi:hypothetical protein
VGVDQSDQRNEAVYREEDMANAPTSLAELIGEAELDSFATRQQMPAIPAGQSGKQKILCRGTHRLTT